MIEMELVGVEVLPPSNSPILMLRESEGARRVLPVYIHLTEAKAIQLGIDKWPVERPLTHDLMKQTFEELGVTLQRVVVTELRDRTFYAELELYREGTVHRVSSRPSDAIALAIRTDTPIFCAESVLDQAGKNFEEEDVGEEEDSEQLLDEFKEFIDSVTPEDFDS